MIWICVGAAVIVIALIFLIVLIIIRKFNKSKSMDKNNSKDMGYYFEYDDEVDLDVGL